MRQHKNLHIESVIPRPLAAATVLLLVSSVAGCASDYYPPLTPLGDATAQNMAVQVVNPDPPIYTTPPDLNGRRAGVAINRYFRNRVVQPQDLDVVDSGTSGSSSN